jgi:hypothetical protein
VRRFVQEDPIGYAGGGNLYAYAGGNPIEARDPSGTTWMDEVKVNWADLYLWNRCWSDRCDGNLWRRGEAWWGLRWNTLTSLERTANYDRYKTQFDKVNGAGAFDRALREGGCSYCSGSTRALDPTEFGSVYSGVMDLANELDGDDDLGRLYAVSKLSQLANTGRIAVNNQYASTMTADPSHSILWINSGYLVFNASQDDLHGTYEVAFALAHEMMHFRLYWLGGAWLNQCAVDSAAARATGLALGQYSRC